MQSKRKGFARAFPGEDRLAWVDQEYRFSSYWVTPNFLNKENPAQLMKSFFLVCLFQEVWREANVWEEVKTQSSIRGTKRKYFRLVILGYCYRLKWFSSSLDTKLLWIGFCRAGEGVALTWSSLSSDALWNPQDTFTIQNLAFGHWFLSHSSFGIFWEENL